MDMIEKRNPLSHAYNREVAAELVTAIRHARVDMRIYTFRSPVRLYCPLPSGRYRRTLSESFGAFHSEAQRHRAPQAEYAL